MSNERQTPTTENLGKDMNLVVGVSAPSGQESVTVRKAGGLRDMKLPVSPVSTPLARALQNLTKAINLALQSDFLKNELDRVYKAARVRNGRVHVLHKDYIGLGDNVFAKIGKAAKSFKLTLEGPDPASPEGKAWIEEHGGGSISGMLNLLGRKLNLIQEYEDKAPTYVEQMFDRLEAANMIVGWDRAEWEITTEVIGLDIIITPLVPPQEPAGST